MKKLLGILATLNFTLPFIGYVLVTSLLLTGVDSSLGAMDAISQKVTVPYRLFTIVLALLVIVLAPKSRSYRIPKQISWLFVFWLLLIIRIIYDLWIRTDVPPGMINVRRTVLYVPICLLPAIAAIFSYKLVNFTYAFHIVFWGFVVSLVLMLVNNPMLLIASEDIVQRFTGNLAFGPLQLAAFGASIIIMCFAAYKAHKYNKILLLFLSLFGAFVLIRAASRGPLVAFVATFGFYMMSKMKNLLKFSILFIIFILLLLVFSDTLLELLGRISPVFSERFSIEEGSDFTNGRSALYKVGFAKFLHSPLWGDSFAIFNNDPIAAKYMVKPSEMSESGYIWSHNMILDAFMGLGVIGGSIFLYVYKELFKKAFYLFKNNDPRFWFVLLTLLKVISGFFSGAFYLNDSLTFCIVVLFLIWKDNINERAIGCNT